jgi:hypothetical protein
MVFPYRPGYPLHLFVIGVSVWEDVRVSQKDAASITYAIYGKQEAVFSEAITTY